MSSSTADVINITLAQSIKPRILRHAMATYFFTHYEDLNTTNANLLDLTQTLGV